MGDSRLNFGFAFNDSDFSDRVLHIEILPEEPSHKSEKSVKEDAVEIKSLHISSPILAANSPFFYKLFKNGMKESQEKHITLKINASEEEALMELLNFMYKNTLSVTTAPDLLNVLKTADKFEVTSCVIHCSELLKNMPMSLESAILYLELTYCEAVQLQIDAAKQYLLEEFRDFSTKSQQQKAMKLPLSGVEFVLGNDGLEVISEDAIFNFILDWSRVHYTKVEERRRILSKHLVRFIYFPYMTFEKLNEVLVCPDFVLGEVSKLVLEALHFNAGFPYGRRIIASKDGHILKRVYHHHPIKVVHLESPLPLCFVYFYFAQNEMYSSFPLESQRFSLDEKSFYISTQYCFGGHIEFGLHVYKCVAAQSFTTNFEISVLTKEPSMEFKSMGKLNNVRVETQVIDGWWKFHQRIALVGDRSKYFIDGIMHLRVELTLNHNSQA